MASTPSLPEAALTSGASSADLTRSCLDHPYSGPATTTITWHTGQTSRFASS